MSAVKSTTAFLRTTTAARVKDYIRDQIISGAFRAGERIRQDELAQQLGISRIPLREGLAHLEAEGFVRIEPHVGAVVAALSLEDARELLELRALLECRLISAALPNIAASNIEHAESFLMRLHPDSKVEIPRAEWIELNWQFHECLYSPANMPRTLGIVNRLHLHTSRYVRHQIALEGRVERSKKQHYQLLDLVRKKNTKELLQVLEHHILNALEDLKRP
jgi:DNA-binding GntR family transcriptional regulator